WRIVCGVLSLLFSMFLFHHGQALLAFFERQVHAMSWLIHGSTCDIVACQRVKMEFLRPHTAVLVFLREVDFLPMLCGRLIGRCFGWDVTISCRNETVVCKGVM
ncbi:unnamed protein product, partial [Laminaria digitata]